MNKNAVILSAVGICFLLAGCDSSQTTHSLAPSAQKKNQNSPHAKSVSTAHLPKTESKVQSTSSLIPYAGFSSNGVSVDVPKNWRSAITQGGDYSAVTFTNPQNANEQMKVLYSSCVGCYMGTNVSQTPDPANAISEPHPSHIQKSANNQSVIYDFSNSGNPYQGEGVLTISNNESGYAELDVTVSPNDSTLRTKIINSFHFKP